MDRETISDIVSKVRQEGMDKAYEYGQSIVLSALEQGRRVYPENEGWATSYALGVLEANIGLLLARMAQPEA